MADSQTKPTADSSEEKKPGLMDKIGQELNHFGKTISKEVEHVGDKINKVAAEHATGSPLNLFQTGNKIQLVSKASGRTVQIVSGPEGLVVDGLGGEGAEAANAVWTVINEGHNQIRLHNNFNFLAAANGAITVKNMPEGSPHGDETRFQLVKIHDDTVALESIAERKHHLGIMPNGELKSAMAAAAAGQDEHWQFSVRVIY